MGGGVSLAINEPAVTRPQHPTSTVHTRVGPGTVRSVGLDKCVMMGIHYNITRSRFPALKILGALPAPPPSPLTLAFLKISINPFILQ